MTDRTPRPSPQLLYQQGFDDGYKQASESAARIIDVLSGKIKRLEGRASPHGECADKEG